MHQIFLWLHRLLILIRNDMQCLMTAMRPLFIFEVALKKNVLALPLSS